MASKWIFLSYPLSNTFSAYRNGMRIEVSPDSSIEQGDATNNTTIRMSSHFGTHLDFPSHFSETGARCEDYLPEFFLFSRVGTADVKPGSGSPLISAADLEAALHGMDEAIECLVLRTGMGFYRFDEKYWNDNYGFDTGVAAYLRERFPRLRVLGFDLISLSSVHRRETGRNVHREFFENGILPLEDMDLRQFSNGRIEEMILSPLRVAGAEAAPITAFAKINPE